jgi:pimeloyl-ACP methyl ester carboxylesterase
VPTAWVHGRRIHYEHIGKGPPLLLLHGGGGSSRGWHRVVEPLHDSRTLYIPDLPGHGRSEDPPLDPPEAWESWATFAGEFASAVGTRPGELSILAHSLGALAAASWILSGGAFERAVLVAPPGIGGSRFGGKLFRRSLDASGRGLLESYIRRVLAAKPDAVPDEDWEMLLEDSHRAGKIVPRLLRGRPRLDTLPRPDRRLESVLLLWGEHDRVVPAEAAPHWKRHLTGSRLQILSGLGHLPMLEEPASFVAAVSDFLSGILHAEPGRPAT